MPIQEFIARRIREERVRVGLTQAELGERIGVGAQAVYIWEAGERFPRAEYIDGMAAAFGIQPEHLLGEPRPPTPAEALEVLRLALHQPKLSPLESRAIEALRSLTPDQLLSAVTVIEATAHTPGGEASEPTHLQEELAKKKG